ncbi:MAG: hypothetical protein R3F20_17565 [Planctomycetota bacterium]
MRVLVGSILLATALLGAIGALVLPLGAAPDELDHFRVASHIAGVGTLPDPATSGMIQAQHPPLGYLTLAGVMRLGLRASETWSAPAGEEVLGRIRRDPFDETLAEAMEDDRPADVIRAAVQPWEARILLAPVWVLHLMRLAALLAGLLGFWLLLRLAARLGSAGEDGVSGGRAAVALVGACLLSPSIVYLCAAISNDAILFATATLAAATALRAHLREDRRWRTAVLVGGLVGLAFLTKATALATGAFCGLLMLETWRRGETARAVLGRVAAAAAAVLAVAGWAYVRNWRLTGSPKADETVVGRYPGLARVDALTLDEAWPLPARLFRSLWDDVYGGRLENFAPVAIVLGSLAMTCGLLGAFEALAGLRRAEDRRARFPQIAALAATVVLAIGLLLHAQRFQVAQGATSSRRPSRSRSSSRVERRRCSGAARRRPS